MVTTYTREDDLVVALQEAARAMGACGRFDEIARVNGDQEAAKRVTEVADVFVAWLRRIEQAKLTLVAIEEIDTGRIVTSTPTKGTAVTDISTNQRARYSVTAKDARGYAGDYALAARASDSEVVLVEYFQVGDIGNTSNGMTNPDGSSAEIDQVLATFNGKLGTSTIETYDPANPTVVLSADTVVANPGNVASASMGAATIEEIPALPLSEPATEPGFDTAGADTL